MRGRSMRNQYARAFNYHDRDTTEVVADRWDRAVQAAEQVGGLTPFSQMQVVSIMEDEFPTTHFAESMEKSRERRGLAPIGQ